MKYVKENNLTLSFEDPKIWDKQWWSVARVQIWRKGIAIWKTILPRIYTLRISKISYEWTFLLYLSSFFCEDNLVLQYMDTDSIIQNRTLKTGTLVSELKILLENYI